jgi:hypothetical protein
MAIESFYSIDRIATPRRAIFNDQAADLLNNHRANPSVGSSIITKVLHPIRTTDSYRNIEDKAVPMKELTCTATVVIERTFPGAGF